MEKGKGDMTSMSHEDLMQVMEAALVGYLISMMSNREAPHEHRFDAANMAFAMLSGTFLQEEDSRGPEVN